MLLIRQLLFHLSLMAGMLYAPAIFSARLECGSGKQFQTLSSAIQAANPGDLIEIFPGVYKESGLQVTKPIQLVGIDFPIIDGGGKGDIFQLQGSGVQLVGLVIRNSGKSNTRDYAGIKLIKGNHCLIERCRFLDTYFGVHLDQSSDCVVRNNYFNGNARTETSSGNGIHLWKCERFAIIGNTIEKHRDGIYFEFVKNSQILLNDSRKNLRYGLHFMFSDNDTYRNNTFTDNGAGVAVMYSQHIQMIENTFRDNWGPTSYGLLLKDINSGKIFRNQFNKNTVGIQMENANKLVLKGNDFYRSGWAIRMLGNCEYDSLVGNNFLGNSFDVATNSMATGNSNFLSGNYWDRYSGYDLNRDHRGDIPYRPVSLFSMMVEAVPSSVVLLHSFLTDLLDGIEKNLPSLIPETLCDHSPTMRLNKF